jgi:hypothetical protein
VDLFLAAVGRGFSSSNVIGLIGVAVTVVGFCLALYQLKKTKGAAVAAQEAVESSERNLLRNQLLIVLPQFTTLAVDLDYAAEENDRKFAMRTLVSISRLSAEAAGLLTLLDDVDATVIERLKDFSRSASVCKADILARSAARVSNRTGGVRQEMAELLTEMGGLTSTISVTTGGR